MSESRELDAALRAWISGAGPKGLGIRSAMGTGKSTLMDTVVRKMPPGATMLAVTFRQTLALELSRKLKSHGFVSYRDVPPEDAIDSRADYPRVICQIESLHRLRSAFGDTPAFDLVVVDEMESALRHLGGSPTVKSPLATTELFSDLLHRAGRVLTLDAYMGDCALGFARSIGLPQRLLHNVHKTPERTFEMTADVFQWKKDILDDVLCGANVVVASLSASLARRGGARVAPQLPPPSRQDTQKHGFFGQQDQGGAHRRREVHGGQAGLAILTHRQRRGRFFS